MQQTSNRNLILGIVGVTILIFAGLIWALVKAPADTGSGAANAPQDEAVGFLDLRDPGYGTVNTSTRVIVHLYEDFQCPACGAAEPGVRYAMQTYGDRVRFVWKDFPLEQLHPNARIAAEAARCAQVQGRFWDYHAALYDHQTAWADSADPKPAFIGYARDLKLDDKSFQTCLNGAEQDQRVQDDMAEGAHNNVDRTPTVFVNRRRYYGMAPAEWDAVLQDALAREAGKGSATTSTNP